MSTSYTATVIYGYSLPRHELTRSRPNPLFGKVKFDPETGEKVEKTIEEDIELALDSGERLKQMTRFVRFDTGYDDRHHVLLGVQLAEQDLDCGAPDPEKLTLLSDEDCAKVATEAKKLLDKAGLTFDESQMGYYLAGYVG